MSCDGFNAEIWELNVFSPLRLARPSVEPETGQRTLLDEPVPGSASWIYVFGSVTFLLFVVQAAPGMFLALYYAPTPDHAYDSVRFIETEITFGWFVPEGLSLGSPGTVPHETD